MSKSEMRRAARNTLACVTLGSMLAVAGCTGHGGGGGSTSVSVAYGYGGYYGPYCGGGYYAPYPPVVVVPPGERPDRPNGGNRPTSRPAPRPAPRPMPRRR